MEETDFTLEGRVLCGDDACIGTVGPDKRCKVCGKPYEGDAEVATGATAAASDDDDAGPGGENDAPAPESPDADAGEADGRTCCPDDSCIGIIGANGACGICGSKPTTPS